MRFALMYGSMSSALHDGFDVDGLYAKQGLTGSESSFFNLAWGLSERGHQVDVFCKTKVARPAPKLAGAYVYPLGTPVGPDYDAYVAWNEPDMLRKIPRSALRVCAQQLNDFDYAGAGFDDFVDSYVMPSEVHRRYLCGASSIKEVKTAVIPNSVNLEFFRKAEKRPGSVVYCSSPDRGLHRLLEIFPRIRERVPEANLKIFYRFEPWYEMARGLGPGLDVGLQVTGRRARYINECLLRLGTRGENGVTLVGPVSNQEMARELCQAKVMAYPCDPIRFTEGFSVSTLDACASWCMPVISDLDAIGDIYGAVAAVIPGRPVNALDAWVGAVCTALKEDMDGRVAKARSFAEGFSRERVTAQWEELLQRLVASKRAQSFAVEARP